MTRTTPTETSRRQLVVGAGSVCLLGVGLAACSSDSGSGPASTPSASAGTGESASNGSSKPATVVALADVPVGGAVSAKIGSTNVIVSQPKKGDVVAFNATCPHAGGQVAPDGDVLKCPLHRSTFNPTTGEALTGPALQTASHALKEIPVAVDGKNVVTG